MKKNRLNLFDLLRLIAATLVIYSHSYPLLGITPPDVVTRILPFTNGGTLGVWIFFIISGYLNTKSIKNNNTFVFLINRSLRIFPGLFVALLFSIFVIGPLCTNLPMSDYFSNHKTWQYIHQNLFLTPNYILPGVFDGNRFKSVVNGSIWTLPTEALLYLTLPLIVKIFRFELRGFVAISAILFLLFVSSFSFDTSKINTILLGNFVNVVQNSFLFFLGSLISYTNSEKTTWRQFIFLYLLLVVLSRTGYGIFSFLLIFPFVVIKTGSIQTSILKLKNDISYGVYIYAFQIQQSVYHFLHGSLSPTGMMFVSISITYPIAYISWRFVEKPILEKRHYFASKILRGDVTDPPDVRVAL